MTGSPRLVHDDRPDSAYGSRKNSRETTSTSHSSLSEFRDEKSRNTPSGTPSVKVDENLGEKITKRKQVKVLVATSLMSFWIIGKPGYLSSQPHADLRRSYPELRYLAETLRKRFSR